MENCNSIRNIIKIELKLELNSWLNKVLNIYIIHNAIILRSHDHKGEDPMKNVGLYDLLILRTSYPYDE